MAHDSDLYVSSADLAKGEVEADHDLMELKKRLRESVELIETVAMHLAEADRDHCALQETWLPDAQAFLKETGS